MRIFGFSREVIERFSGILIHIAMWGVFAMMLLVVTDITLRAIVRRSILIAEEVGGYLLVLVAFLAMAEALKEGRHVRLEFFVRRLPLRAQAWLGVVVNSIGLAALIVVFWRSVVMVYRSWDRGVIVTGALLTPVYLPQMVLAIGLLALTLQNIVELSKMVLALRELPKAAAAEAGEEVSEI